MQMRREGTGIKIHIIMGLKVLIRRRGEFMHSESSRQFSKDPTD